MKIKATIEEAQNSIHDGNSLIRIAQLLLNESAPPEDIHEFLKLGHYPAVNSTFYRSDRLGEWFGLLVDLIKLSAFSTNCLIKQRVDQYQDKPLFQLITDNHLRQISYKESWELIQKTGHSLKAWMQDTMNPVVGIYTPNSLEGALVDLACLSFNIMVVPIPANVSGEQLKYILKHSQISHLFIGGSTPNTLFNQIKRSQTHLSVVQFPNSPSLEYPSISWKMFLNPGTTSATRHFRFKLSATDMDSPTSIMYTSGTTADPKGIIFTQTNILTKRFARALALPDFSSNETFLSYLPLYHTFGRFLELMGTIFWGATYTFSEAQTFNTLLKDFRITKPSVFISIPKRWIQLYEHLITQIQIETLASEIITGKLKEATSGKLKWGLSAAGYLDPEIFLFFQKNGVNVLSGYGMTEATGGITMTPPNDYLQDSVGLPLPGLETQLAEDGELLIRGPYISPGYHGKTVTPTLTDGWFHTGDVFKKKKGHYFIIDRKKEIYKNTRGQTISPQKIENMFNDFEAIDTVFLVGDGREYNTLLIYPDTKNTPFNYSEATTQIRHDYFSALVQSVNSFLAPYERVINFTIISRSFSDQYGELTPKKTYKRKQILKNFADFVEPMYEKNYIRRIHGNHEIRIPNWLLSEKGIIRSDIIWDGSILTVRNRDEKVTLKWNKQALQVGDYHYTCVNDILDLQKVLDSPDLWLGNKSFVDFIGNLTFRTSQFESHAEIKLDFPSLEFQTTLTSQVNRDKLKTVVRKGESSLVSLHNAAMVLHSSRKEEVNLALEVLTIALNEKQSNLSTIAFNVLLRLRCHPSLPLRIKVMELLLPFLSGEMFLTILIETYQYADTIGTTEEFVWNDNLLESTHYETILTYLDSQKQKPEAIHEKNIPIIQLLLALVCKYSIRHPASYIRSRTELIWWQMIKAPDQILSTTQRSYFTLINGFRNWLGLTENLAIDRDTGEEYTWQDVVVFDSNVEEQLQSKLLNALENTVLLKEAIFIFSKRRLIHLGDIQHRGVWIKCLGRSFGKSVFRVLVQTRDMESYNFVINVNEQLEKEFIEDEIRWLVITGFSNQGLKLVEDFGGYWAEYDLYTEEYIPGETLFQYLERKKDEIAGERAIDRWQMRWLHFIWNGIIAYVDFWRRSNYTLRIADASPRNLIIPQHDYAIGTRLISITDRTQVLSASEFFIHLFEHFIIDTEREYPGLRRMADWEILFSAFLQTVTVKKGLQILHDLNNELKTKSIRKRAKELGLTTQHIQAFIDDVNENGLLTKQVVFAALRYERWLELNPKATTTARSSILQELYKDYDLGNLLDDYPETRIRFFLMTCFKNANPELTNKLVLLQKSLRARTIMIDDLELKLHEIRDSIDLTEEEEYFLTRLIFEHLDAVEYNELIEWDLGAQSHLSLMTVIEDNKGERYHIRPPFRPKEIARFHTLLREANLSEIFQQQHEFLLIITMKEQLIGGVFWKKIDHKIAYLEKIVIRAPYRKRHLGLRLLEELFKRLKNRRYAHITVGYFQAEFFEKLGFQIDRKFGGLVKSL